LNILDWPTETYEVKILESISNYKDLYTKILAKEYYFINFINTNKIALDKEERK